MDARTCILGLNRGALSARAWSLLLSAWGWPLLMVSWMFTFNSCSEEVASPSAVRSQQLSDHLEVSVIGGSLMSVKSFAWGSGQRYDIELGLESLRVETSVVARGCQPALIHFYVNRNPERYRVFTRAYEGVNGSIIDTDHRAGVIQRAGDRWIPSSNVRELSLLGVNSEGTLTSQSASSPAGSSVETSTFAWSVLINVNHERAQISPQRYTAPEASLPLIEQRQSRCVLHRDERADDRDDSTLSNSDNPMEIGRLLLRHQLEYQSRSKLSVGVLAPRDHSASHLSASLREALRLNLDAVVILGSLSLGDSSSLSASRAVLAETPLFWWALPSLEESSLASQWLRDIGSLNYAIDLGSLRLMFLDLTSGALSNAQLNTLSRWTNVTPLGQLDERAPHSSILFSVVPLVRSDVSDEDHLQYRIGAIRALSALSASHLTRKVVGEGLSEDSSDSSTTKVKEVLGIPTLEPPHTPNRLLILELQSDCTRSEITTGEQDDIPCVEWSTVELNLSE